MTAAVNITGQRFGRLTAVRAVEKHNSRWCWLCRCDCGQTTIVYGSVLRNGRTRSCGCWQREIVSTHGASRTREYRTWIDMMRRCYNPNNRHFKNWGGRGIKVCKRWHTFINFLADMGLRPAGRYSIERVNNNGNYEPSNCIWLPLSEQNKNTQRTNHRSN